MRKHLQAGGDTAHQAGDGLWGANAHLLRITAVDIDPASTTYGRFVGVELNEENHRQLWIPPGYAHGFRVVSDVADFQHQNRYEEPQLIKIKMFNRSTSAAI